ncbi:LysE family translocator [Reinekea blandensis]|uniref:Threonine efflux protein n=1 Tax=Reinekea blandensis MED297 TaxID=314283 RepID=A4BCI6_9GAMM|nr:LysE family translocator [Reinekea blandensis]EAR10252.1 hypothetical protein MED297_13552 [Reinekea sp. MED297] [Reinekea blandensis MED297]
MTFEAAFSFFIIVFIFGVTPGPGVFAIIARALSTGGRSCWLLAFGMVVSDILYLIAACFGLAVIAQEWGEVFLLIRVVGAAYLAYLGWKMWTAPVSSSALDGPTGSRGAVLAFIQGFTISASNPKVILFYIAFLPTFLDVQRLSGGDILLVSVLTLISLMMGLMLIATLAASARTFFETPRKARLLNKGAGSIMLGAAGFLLLKSS